MVNDTRKLITCYPKISTEATLNIYMNDKTSNKYWVCQILFLVHTYIEGGEGREVGTGGGGHYFPIVFFPPKPLSPPLTFP